MLIATNNPVAGRKWLSAFPVWRNRDVCKSTNVVNQLLGARAKIWLQEFDSGVHIVGYGVGPTETARENWHTVNTMARVPWLFLSRHTWNCGRVPALSPRSRFRQRSSSCLAICIAVSVTSVSFELKRFSLSWLQLAAWLRNISLGPTDPETPQETDLVIILLAAFTIASCPYANIFYKFISWKLANLQNMLNNNIVNTVYFCTATRTKNWYQIQMYVLIWNISGQLACFPIWLGVPWPPESCLTTYQKIS